MNLSKLNIFGNIYNFKDTEARTKGEENAKALAETNKDLFSAKESISSVDGKVDSNIKSIGLLKKAIENIKNKLSSIRSTIVSSDTPTDENVELWINPNETESFSIPEIKDDATNAVDTWSSKKISDELALSSQKIESLQSQVQIASDEEANTYLGGSE